jgi:hypothetical protein
MLNSHTLAEKESTFFRTCKLLSLSTVVEIAGNP